MSRSFVSAVHACVLLLAAACVTAIAWPVQAGEPISTAQLREATERHLRASNWYRSGDLICRKDVEPIFNELLEQGIEPTDDREAMYAAFLPDDAYLVGLLRGPEGKAFMRRVQELPGAYDFLDRLSWFPAGRETLYRIVHGKEGFAQFQAMLTATGRTQTEAVFAHEPRARNLFLPTGRIYTEHDLLRQLEAVHGRPAGAT